MDTATLLAALEIVIGGMYIILVGVVARSIGKLGRALPWMLVLLTFLVMRALDRIVVRGIGAVESEAIILAGELIMVGLLGLLILGSDRIAEAITMAERHHRRASTEYERALQDYLQLARHRLANPLTVISGGITTLRDHDLDEETRLEILEHMADKVEELRHVSLSPEVRNVEEHELRPLPEHREE